MSTVTVAVSQEKLAQYQRMERALQILVSADCIIDHPSAPEPWQGSLEHLIAWLDNIYEPEPSEPHDAAPTMEEQMAIARKAAQEAGR